MNLLHHKPEDGKMLKTRILSSEAQTGEVKIKSENLSHYYKFFDGVECQNVELYLNQLKQANIEYHPNIFVSDVQIKMFSESQNCKIVTLYVSLSYFTLGIRLFNEDGCSPVKVRLEQIGKGTFGTVYYYSDRFEEQIAIKNSHCLGKNNKSIHAAIKQYCIGKLLSCFKIGPKMPMYFGFDLIIYDDSIEFAMEMCQSTSSTMIISAADVLKIKADLKFLHSLKIVHNDIKFDNLMFSKAYNKLVFIDFNCSGALREEIGEKTLTGFKGNIANCSQEMKKLYFTNICDYVDLYYNDVWGLRKLIHREQKQNEINLNFCLININDSKRTILEQSNLRFFQCFYLHVKLRKLIADRKIAQVNKYLMKYLSEMSVTEQMRKNNRKIIKLSNAGILSTLNLNLNEMNKVQLEPHREIAEFNVIIQETLKILLEVPLTKQLLQIKELLLRFFQPEEKLLKQIEKIYKKKSLLLPVNQQKVEKYRKRFEFESVLSTQSSNVKMLELVGLLICKQSKVISKRIIGDLISTISSKETSVLLSIEKLELIINNYEITDGELIQVFNVILLKQSPVNINLDPKQKYKEIQKIYSKLLNEANQQKRDFQLIKRQQVSELIKKVEIYIEIHRDINRFDQVHALFLIEVLKDIMLWEKQTIEALKEEFKEEALKRVRVLKGERVLKGVLKGEEGEKILKGERIFKGEEGERILKGEEGEGILKGEKILKGEEGEEKEEKEEKKEENKKEKEQENQFTLNRKINNAISEYVKKLQIKFSQKFPKQFNVYFKAIYNYLICMHFNFHRTKSNHYFEELSQFINKYGYSENELKKCFIAKKIESLQIQIGRVSHRRYLEQQQKQSLHMYCYLFRYKLAQTCYDINYHSLNIDWVQNFEMLTNVYENLQVFISLVKNINIHKNPELGELIYQKCKSLLFCEQFPLVCKLQNFPLICELHKYFFIKFGEQKKSQTSKLFTIFKKRMKGVKNHPLSWETLVQICLRLNEFNECQQTIIEALQMYPIIENNAIQKLHSQLCSCSFKILQISQGSTPHEKLFTFIDKFITHFANGDNFQNFVLYQVTQNCCDYLIYKKDEKLLLKLLVSITEKQNQSYFRGSCLFHYYYICKQLLIKMSNNFPNFFIKFTQQIYRQIMETHYSECLCALVYQVYQIIMMSGNESLLKMRMAFFRFIIKNVEKSDLLTRRQIQMDWCHFVLRQFHNKSGKYINFGSISNQKRERLISHLMLKQFRKNQHKSYCDYSENIRKKLFPFNINININKKAHVKILQKLQKYNCNKMRYIMNKVNNVVDNGVQFSKISHYNQIFFTSGANEENFFNLTIHEMCLFHLYPLPLRNNEIWHLKATDMLLHKHFYIYRIYIVETRMCEEVRVTNKKKFLQFYPTQGFLFYCSNDFWEKRATKPIPYEQIIEFKINRAKSSLQWSLGGEILVEFCHFRISDPSTKFCIEIHHEDRECKFRVQVLND